VPIDVLIVASNYLRAERLRVKITEVVSLWRLSRYLFAISVEEFNERIDESAKGVRSVSWR